MFTWWSFAFWKVEIKEFSYVLTSRIQSTKGFICLFTLNTKSPNLFLKNISLYLQHFPLHFFNDQQAAFLSKDCSKLVSINFFYASQDAGAVAHLALNLFLFTRIMVLNFKWGASLKSTFNLHINIMWSLSLLCSQRIWTKCLICS